MTLVDVQRQVWHRACSLDRLTPGRGVAVLVGGRAVALFLLADGSTMCAVDDVDPYSGASVLSRGLLGQTNLGTGEVHYVASPLRKQRFDLASGCCLDGDEWVSTWEVRVTDGMVEVRSEASRPGNGQETTS